MSAETLDASILRMTRKIGRILANNAHCKAKLYVQTDQKYHIALHAHNSPFKRKEKSDETMNT